MSIDSKFYKPEFYNSHNGGMGSPYSSLAPGEIRDYEEFMQENAALFGKDAYAGAALGSTAKKVMIDTDLDNNMTIMPVKDDEGRPLPQTLNIISGNANHVQKVSLDGVYIHSPTIKDVRGKNLTITTLKDLERSSLKDEALIYGRSWVARDGYAIDTYDPYFANNYIGGRKKVDPNHITVTLIQCIPTSLFLGMIIISQYAKMAGVSKGLVIIIYLIILAVITGVSLYRIKKKHRENLIFTTNMINAHLKEEANIHVNMDEYSSESMNLGINDNLLQNMNFNDNSLQNMKFDFADSSAPNVGNGRNVLIESSGGLFDYCPACYAARIDNETTCICCGASLVQDSAFYVKNNI